MAEEEFIAKKPRDYEPLYYQPMRVVTYEEPVMPDIIKPEYDPSPYIKATGNVAEFEAVRHRTRIEYETKLIDAQETFERESL